MANRWRTLTTWHGRIYSDSIADLWSTSLTAQDPPIPNLALETAAGSGTSGSASITLAGVAVAAAAGVAVAGLASVAAGPASLSATGGVAVAGEASLSLAGATVVATGTDGGAAEPTPWLAARVAGRSASRTAWRRVAGA
jgi:hypothetical protein